MLHRIDRGDSKWKSLSAALPSARGVLLAAQSFGGAEISGIRPVGEQDRNRAGGPGSQGLRAGGVAPQVVRRCWKEMRPLGAGWMSAPEAQPSGLAPRLVSSTERASRELLAASDTKPAGGSFQQEREAGGTPRTASG